MILPWILHTDTNKVILKLEDNIYYEAYPDGELHIAKYIDEQLVGTYYDETWEDEKQWISDNYSDRYGVYEPCLPENLEEDDPYSCVFGKTPNGIYLDRLQRSSTTMELHETITTFLFEIPNVGRVHTNDGGKTIWFNPYCEWNNEYYNSMRCDIYPNNPGWVKMTKEGAIALLDEHINKTPNKVTVVDGVVTSEIRNKIVDSIINETVKLPA